MIFYSFDKAVEYYEEAALRTLGRYTNLSAEESGRLVGESKKTVQNKVKRHGNTKDWSIQDLVRWMIATDRITLENIIKQKRAA